MFCVLFFSMYLVVDQLGRLPTSQEIFKVEVNLYDIRGRSSVHFSGFHSMSWKTFYIIGSNLILYGYCISFRTSFIFTISFSFPFECLRTFVLL